MPSKTKVLTADAAKRAVRTVMKSRGGKPIDARAWLKSLPPARQDALWERYLGHFGPSTHAGSAAERRSPVKAAAKKKAAPVKRAIAVKKVSAGKRAR